ncbi:similar to Saccharomyces cerevisiae YGR283C Protein of unknown function [Maudiozyma barnettii]|uniref:Uncharacterized protein n=1 Tax=Maudiozyma barnettii TaxID=61262 RepID=A0A8H2ZG74_9SACH|nr:uncharacterized protein KABA2_02S10318 [Kazachstania barnettii]CAB4253039.1 similar to Saccharomyces cerevisiae YGR283C Protein of unknown function [Kazachstania barnettii]CAD1780426.1 similar to Saccharomyces cerevisiae YGR283C Protein of unknown function [Kazachstania barnettii]
MAPKRKENETPKNRSSKKLKLDNKTIVTKKKNTKKTHILVKPKKTLRVDTKILNHSICVPTTILKNCTNLDQITHIVYQIAKAATIFNVGELVILELGDRKTKQNSDDKQRLSDSMLIASLLQYFVTPPYLVKSVFKKQYMKYFVAAEKLPRLTALPFMRHYNEDEGRYREGLAVRMENPSNKSTKEYKQTKYINIGKDELLSLKTQLVPTNVRVTVDAVERKVVSPVEAYGDFVGAQSSFGYHVRVTKNFGSIFTDCSFPNGYSQCIWANSGDFFYDEQEKKYSKVETKVPRITKIVKPETNENDSSTTTQPANLLIVFGKWYDIKKSFDESKDQFEGCDGAHQFFDGQIEMPGASPQGNICIEDSCMITLSVLDAME